MGAWLHWGGVGGLGCRSAGDVTGERGLVPGLTDLVLVVWDVGQLEMLQVRRGGYLASLGLVVWGISLLEMLQVRGVDVWHH